MWNLQGLIKNVGSRISKDDQEKIMRNFQGSLFLALEFPKDLTQLCGISRGWSLFCLVVPGEKKKNEKLQGGFKIYPPPPPPPTPPVLIFSGIAHSFLQDHNRCTRARCALLCIFPLLLLTLRKLLSNEFLRDNSFMKKYYKNNCEFHEILTKWWWLAKY